MAPSRGRQSPLGDAHVQKVLGCHRCGATPPDQITLPVDNFWDQMSMLTALNPFGVNTSIYENTVGTVCLEKPWPAKRKTPTATPVENCCGGALIPFADFPFCFQRGGFRSGDPRPTFQNSREKDLPGKVSLLERWLADQRNQTSSRTGLQGQDVPFILVRKPHNDLLLAIGTTFVRESAAKCLAKPELPAALRGYVRIGLKAQRVPIDFPFTNELCRGPHNVIPKCLFFTLGLFSQGVQACPLLLVRSEGKAFYELAPFGTTGGW